MVVAVALVVAPSASAAKRALIIAIGDYPASGGYRTISSANDVPLIRGALERQAFDAITVLADAEATKVGIGKALARLRRDTRPGDVVVVHYSGHGHQVTDDNADETDGLDEVLVPYDAPRSPGPGYHGQGHIRDDELATALSGLRRAAGPDGHVLMLFDSCHSGTATRQVGLGAIRGVIDDPIGEPATRRGEHDTGFVDPSRGEALASFAVLSAARQDQPAREIRDGGRAVGSLSWALSRALAETWSGATYRTLFADVKRRIGAAVPGQEAQFEGALDALLFDGHAVDQAEWYPVRSGSGTSVWIDAGELMTVLPGTRIELHARGTARPSPSTLLATGRVIESKVVTARVELEAAPAVDPTTTWAFVTELGGPPVVVDLSALPPTQASAIAAALREPVRAGTDGGLHLAVQDDRIAVVRGDGVVLDRVDPAPAHVASALIRQVRWQNLRDLHAFDPEVDVRVSVVPASFRMLDASRFQTERLDPAPFTNRAGRLALQPGEYFQIDLDNLGSRAVYVYVLDLTAAGDVSLLVPFGGLAHDRLDPGAKWTASHPSYGVVPFQVGPDLGLETIRVIASTQPLDLSFLLDPGDDKEVATRGGSGVTTHGKVFQVVKDR